MIWCLMHFAGVYYVKHYFIEYLIKLSMKLQRIIMIQIYFKILFSSALNHKLINKNKE